MVQEEKENDSYQIITFIEERVPSIYYLANHITKTKHLNYKKFLYANKGQNKELSFLHQLT